MSVQLISLSEEILFLFFFFFLMQIQFLGVTLLNDGFFSSLGADMDMNSTITTKRTKLITATSDHTLHLLGIQYLPLYFSKLNGFRIF